ncbi:MAG TPA: decaprenyl-phosphate phosphoribosyltransferase, partial [Geobacteraceae bacterium]
MNKSSVTGYLKLLRMSQWLKNLMLFFPPFLGGVVLAPGVIAQGILPFGAFCLGSSATYVLNDILDAGNDAHHEVKRLRPIPSGRVSRRSAAVFGTALVAGSIFLASFATKPFFLLLIAYLGVTSAYSLKLKEYAIIDLFCISAGFLLRLEAGGEAFGIVISEWLFLSVFLLAIFLSTGKRLCEKNRMGTTSGRHRKSLLSYPDGYLDGIMYMTGGSVLVT